MSVRVRGRKITRDLEWEEQNILSTILMFFPHVFVQKKLFLQLHSFLSLHVVTILDLIRQITSTSTPNLLIV